MRPRTTVRFEVRARILRWPESHAIGDRLISLAQERECEKLILDLGRVSYVTATALGKLIAVRQELVSRGKTLVLKNVRRHVYEVLCVTGLEEIFDVRRPAVKHLLPR